MKKETFRLVRQIALPIGIFLALCAILIIGVFFALFKPNFMRGNGKSTPMDAAHFLTKENDIYSMTTKGAFYYHYYEQFYTLSYIDKMWGIMRNEAFPKYIKV